MVDAGLLPWAIVDSYKPQMWQAVFTRVSVREDLVLREGAKLAWAIRPNSPQLKEFLNNFLENNREGTLFGNIIRNRYIRDFDWAENAVGAAELSRYRALCQHCFESMGQTTVWTLLCSRHRGFRSHASIKA